MENSNRYKVVAVAPTGYQYSSVRFFGYPEKLFGGGYIVEEYFNSEDEAKEYLHERITMHEHSTLSGDEGEITKMRDDVDKYGILEYDAVRGRIVEC